VLEARSKVWEAVATGKSGTFLLEIGTEELPVQDFNSAVEQLRANVPKVWDQVGLEYVSLRIMGTPRRLVVYIEGLAERQRDEEQIIKGPPARVAFDEGGHPTKAAEGFARSQGVKVSDLEIMDFEGKAYAVARRVRVGRSAKEVLAEELPGLIAAIRFPLAMRWNASKVIFSRPIRWYVALLDDEVVPFEYAGVSSGRTTRGIRPEGSPEIVLRTAADYLPAMEANHIMVDLARRRKSVREQIEQLAAEVKGTVPDDPELLDEVANLVEWPTAVRGEFEPKYLTLPPQVLIAVMKKHQRYFPVMRDSKLLPYFLAVANGKNLDVDAVRLGNEEVLRARYADADFFYAADTKKKLEEFLPRLATLTFQDQLGSMLDKVKRLEKLVPRLGKMLGLSEAEMRTASRAAHLCKADLATQMVIEHTSLQGEMGREYALLSGEDEAVAQAIAEHYLPRYTGDALPEGMPGVVVGLADRLDSLLGLFAVGSVPSGSADPYGLRRAALGVVQVLIGSRKSISLREALKATAEFLPVPTAESVLEDVLDFIRQRLRGVLLEAGYRYDLVDAVLAERGEDPYLASVTVSEFARWVEREDWMDLLNAYARCVRITREFKKSFALDPSLFVEPATKALYDAYLKARERVTPQSNIGELLEALQVLIDPITVFFDDVLVMTEDRSLRENRLALLQRISDLPKGIVDLKHVEGF